MDSFLPYFLIPSALISFALIEWLRWYRPFPPSPRFAELRSGGAIVLHDIMADGFNVDHIVISPKGLFVIETKTRSKPKGRDVKITFDGDKVFINGRVPSRDPVKQVLANTTWVQEMLKERTGRSFPARPVILFPGWFVESDAALFVTRNVVPTAWSAGPS